MKLNIDGIEIQINNGVIHINTGKQQAVVEKRPQYESDTINPTIKWGSVARAVRELPRHVTKRIAAHNVSTIYAAASKVNICITVKRISQFEFDVTRLA